MFSIISWTLVGGILPLYRDAVSVFYSSSWLGLRTLVAGIYLSAEMRLVYSTAPAHWATEHSLGESILLQRCSWCILQLQLTGPQNTRWGNLTPLKRCSWCILQLQLTGPQNTRWGILPLCRDAVGVFYSSSRLGHRTLVGGIYPSAEFQLRYSAAPAGWATEHSLLESTLLKRCSWCILQLQLTGPQSTRWGNLTPLQRCSWCILQLQPTGTQNTRWEDLTPLQRCSWSILQLKLLGFDRND